MQQTSDTLFSTMSLIPNEILSMILHHTMRSDTPAHLEDFVQLGRRLQDMRSEHDLENLTKVSCTVKSLSSELSASACVERWFLNRMDSRQGEHFRDWLFINSTCRNFRAWGKRAFFTEKVFVISPSFLRNI